MGDKGLQSQWRDAQHCHEIKLPLSREGSGVGFFAGDKITSMGTRDT